MAGFAQHFLLYYLWARSLPCASAGDDHAATNGASIPYRSACRQRAGNTLYTRGRSAGLQHSFGGVNIDITMGRGDGVTRGPVMTGREPYR
jgi:hypothetical protein